jgi:hypothetical protein
MSGGSRLRYKYVELLEAIILGYCRLDVSLEKRLELLDQTFRRCVKEFA